jgi:hypothetical protein
MEPDKTKEQAKERRKKRTQSILQHKAALDNIFSYLDDQVKSQSSNLDRQSQRKVLILYTGNHFLILLNS